MSICSWNFGIVLGVLVSAVILSLLFFKFKSINRFLRSKAFLLFGPLLKDKYLLLLIGGGGVIFFSNPLGGYFSKLFEDTSVFKNIAYTSALSTMGSAIVASGVFGFMTKSDRFLDYFSEIFFNIIYNPNKKMSEEAIKAKWEILTQSLIEKNTPFCCQSVTKKLRCHFIEKRAEYGFRNSEVILKAIKMDDNHVKIIQIFRTEVVFYEEIEEVKMEHRLHSFEKPVLKKVLINDEEVKPDETKEGDFHRYVYTIKRSQKFYDGKFGSARLDRTIEIVQDIRNDSTITWNYTRYFDGLSVLVKTSGIGYLFRRNGIEAKEPLNPVEDGSGYCRYTLATRGNLLLPGEGFTVVLSKTQPEATT